MREPSQCTSVGLSSHTNAVQSTTLTSYELSSTETKEEKNDIPAHHSRSEFLEWMNDNKVQQGKTIRGHIIT